MSDLPARGGAPGVRPDGPAIAAALLGACLLAATVLSGGRTSDPPFPAVGVPATAERESGAAEVQARTPMGAPTPGDQPAHASEGGRTASSLRAIDINRADAGDLQALPGVGPVLARRIVAHREMHGPFRDPADLLQVPGVGAKRVARLQGLIRTAEVP